MIIQLMWFIISAVLEIVGCWLMLRAITLTDVSTHVKATYALGAITSLTLFALLISIADLGLSGRTYAAYGGIYILTASAWFIFVDGGKPTAWDMVGVVLAFSGTIVILSGLFRNLTLT